MIIFLGNNNLHIYKDLIEESKNDTPNVVVSCQYPYKVPESLIDSHICVNIHYGTLPYYAGCNPVYWQIKKDDRAGVTLHYMDKNFDTGDIIDIYEFPIAGMTADQVYSHLQVMGKRLFKEHYKKILNGTASRKKQDLSSRRYYPKDLVNFDREKRLTCFGLEDKTVRALCFDGKQYPVITVGERDYELRPVYESKD